MILLEKQLKGIIAICIVLAIIPFLIFISGSKRNYKIPEFTNQLSENITVEVVENGISRGIYFVAQETSIDHLLKSIGVQNSSNGNIPLYNGLKLTINSNSEKHDVSVGEIESAKRLALGMPLDINKATEIDLLLVTGIGEATAKKILDLRSELGRYDNIEQLTEIKGIKEKKLTKLRKYLYVKS